MQVTIPLVIPFRDVLYVRLRWNCHHTSRLRLLYGERQPVDDMFSGCTVYLGAPPEVNKVSHIIVSMYIYIEILPQ